MVLWVPFIIKLNDNHKGFNLIFPKKNTLDGFVSGGILFVGGVAVGYVVDGVVINMSGQSVGEWVSDGIDGVVNWF